MHVPSLSTRFFVILSLYYLVSIVQTAIIKLEIDPLRANELHRSRRVARSASGEDENFCDKLETVPKNELSVPTDNTRAPWTNPRVQVWKAPGSEDEFHDILSSRVECLFPATTFLDVFEKLEEEGCWILPFGGVVRDVLRGKPIHDVDAESSCSIEKTMAACKKHFGDQCWTRSGHILHIGGSPDTSTKMDVANWDGTFFGTGTNLEFSTNAIAYDWSQKVIIDLSRQTGPQDACDEAIRIPVQQNQWDQWVNAKGPEKSMRFWKLKAGKGYSPIDEQTQMFMNKRIRNLARSEDGRKTLQKYYCTYALKGIEFVKDENVCKTAADCTKENDFDDSLKDDFGTQFWSATLEPIFKEKMKCEYTTRNECTDTFGAAARPSSAAAVFLSTIFGIGIFV